MVSARSTRVPHFLCEGIMEMTFLLLLMVSLISASPLRKTQRIGAGSGVSWGADQTLNSERSGVTQTQHAPKLKIIPYHSDDKQLELLALKHSLNTKLRPRRASVRGCQLGTCQLHNLANTLYQISKTNGKEESKKASDPQGYGR